MSDRNQTAITRVNQLEKSNRRMKIIGLAALALFGMAATQNHSNVPDLVQSKRFQVVDNKGNVLADLGPFGDKNHPGLGIYDAKGVIRASIGIDAQSDNSGDASYDHKGVLRTFSGAVESGTLKGLSGHFTYDQNGTERIAINVDPVDNFVGLANLDTNGKTRVVTGTGLGGTVPFFNLYDVNQTLRATMSVDYDANGGEGMTFWDKDSVARVTLGIDGNDFGSGFEQLVFLNNNFHNNIDNSVVGAFFSVPGQGGNFVTNDTNGNPTGALPPATP
jgi:hypothetical protein